VLIPQIILGGAIVSVRSQPMLSLSWLLSPVYWGYQAIHRGVTLLPVYHPMHSETEYPVWLPCAALVAQTVVLLVLTACFLRSKDVGKG
jgi:hypothetical protein